MTARSRLAAAAATLACVALGCSHPEPAPERRPIPVKVRTVEKPPGAGLARFSGDLEPAVRVDMAFRVGGYVEAVGDATDAGGKHRAIDKGDFVKKGTVLARIRAADYEQKLATAKAAVNEAKAQAKLAEVELERSKRLFASNSITKAELDAQTARTETAQANVDGAVAQAGQASIALDDTVLRAPMDGVVLSRSIEVGTLVAPGQPAVSVADMRTVKAVFGVPQALVEKLQVGSPLQVFVGAEGEGDGKGGPEKMLDAKVTRIAPSADTNGRVFSVEASLPNDASALRPGSVVSVHVPEATLAAATIAVPLSAIVRSPDKPRGFSVFVLDGAGERAPAHLRDVKLGEVLGNSVTVTDGLALGQRVVTVGATLLRDGSEAVVIP
jgi:multidrug efflux system membrane fusion protein